MTAPRADVVGALTAACWGFSAGIVLAAWMYEPALRSHERNERTLSGLIVQYEETKYETAQYEEAHKPKREKK